MFLAEIDRSHRLLKIIVADHVAPEDARFCLERLQSLLADIQPGFRLLSDLSGIKSMPTTTAPYIGQIMELCAEKGLESVVRVLPPEPRNDIGYAILSQFHYGPDVRIVTCYKWRRPRVVSLNEIRVTGLSLERSSNEVRLGGCRLATSA